MSVPGADELFRRTVVPHQGETDRDGHRDVHRERDGDGHGAGEGSGSGNDAEARRAPSGRVRHDEKMTVYLTAEELLDLEHARLSLRRSGLSVDRGRLVREAIAIALADLQHHGDDSLLVHRLTQA